MSALHLPINFAIQSSIDNGRGRLLWLAPDASPPAVEGLLPRRHYRIDGAATGFIRTDDHGCATLPVTLPHRALIALWPVV